MSRLLALYERSYVRQELVDNILQWEVSRLLAQCDPAHVRPDARRQCLPVGVSHRYANCPAYAWPEPVVNISQWGWAVFSSHDLAYVGASRQYPPVGGEPFLAQSDLAHASQMPIVDISSVGMSRPLALCDPAYVRPDGHRWYLPVWA